MIYIQYMRIPNHYWPGPDQSDHFSLFPPLPPLSLRIWLLDHMHLASWSIQDIHTHTRSVITCCATHTYTTSVLTWSRQSDEFSFYESDRLIICILLNVFDYASHFAFDLFEFDFGTYATLCFILKLRSVSWVCMYVCEYSVCVCVCACVCVCWVLSQRLCDAVFLYIHICI